MVEKGCEEDDPKSIARKAADSATEFVSTLATLSGVNADISIITSLDGEGEPWQCECKALIGGNKWKF